MTILQSQAIFISEKFSIQAYSAVANFGGASPTPDSRKGKEPSEKQRDVWL